MEAKPPKRFVHLPKKTGARYPEEFKAEALQLENAPQLRNVYSPARLCELGISEQRPYAQLGQ